MLRVGNLYATDFGKVSPGGIRSVIEILSRGAAEDIDITHVGIGPQTGPLPRTRDHYLGLGAAVEAGERSGINTEYVKRLKSNIAAVKDRADIFIIHRPEHALALPRHFPFVLVLHGGSWGAWRSRRDPVGMIYPLFELYGALRAKLTLSVARDSHTRIFQHIISPQAITTAYNEQLFSPRVGNDRSGSIARLVSAARLVPEKRLHLVLEAAARLGKVTVDIFGDGPERTALEQRAAELGVCLVMHGHTSPEQLAAWYRVNPAVFILTSRFEGFPVAALEAAGAGVPVVALSAPGITQAIPALGGRVASGEMQLPAAIQQAWRNGNTLTPEQVSATFGTSAVSERFWTLVRGVAENLS